MAELWKRIDDMDMKAESKFRLFRFVTEMLSAAAGLLIWLALRGLLPAGRGWAVCFIGYPFMISLFVSVIYVFNHSFCDGKRHAS